MPLCYPKYKYIYSIYHIETNDEFVYIKPAVKGTLVRNLDIY